MLLPQHLSSLLIPVANASLKAFGKILITKGKLTYLAILFDK